MQIHDADEWRCARIHSSVKTIVGLCVLVVRSVKHISDVRWKTQLSNALLLFSLLPSFESFYSARCSHCLQFNWRRRRYVKVIVTVTLAQFDRYLAKENYRSSLFCTNRWNQMNCFQAGLKVFWKRRKLDIKGVKILRGCNFVIVIQLSRRQDMNSSWQDCSTWT